MRHRSSLAALAMLCALAISLHDANAATVDFTATLTGAANTNSDFGSTFRVAGGTFSATNITIRRNSAAAPDFASGFIVSGGTATVGTLGLGMGNSTGAMTVSGGSLTVTGAITVGNQATSGRGGAMRVLGGTFTSSDTVNGIILSRINGTNANQVASATFTGKPSNVSRPASPNHHMASSSMRLEVLNFSFSNKTTAIDIR